MSKAAAALSKVLGENVPDWLVYDFVVALRRGVVEGHSQPLPPEDEDQRELPLHLLHKVVGDVGNIIGVIAQIQGEEVDLDNITEAFTLGISKLEDAIHESD